MGSSRHPIAARIFARITTRGRVGINAERRQRALAGLSGRVIEVGAGHGLNFPLYPRSVTELVALEPEPYLRGLASEIADGLPFPVHLVEGVAEKLPFKDGAFDAAVASLVLCHVRSLERATAELFRVIHPGGELRFHEHVRSPKPTFARVQRAADALGWPHLIGGCHAGRDSLGAIEAAGFTLEECEQLRFRPFLLDFLSDPLLVGRARRATAST
jgi:SAM-dependent methyltransferase